MTRGSERDEERITITLSEVDALAYESSKMERDLRLSMFREGLLRGLKEGLGYEACCRGEERIDADADWRAGWESGISLGQSSLTMYRNHLEGR